MNMEAASGTAPLSRFEQLRLGREIIQNEGRALQSLASRLGEEFCDAVDRLFDCDGSVIVSGMGKAGLVGQKIAATLASTGTRAHFLHPAEAIHGDLGRVHQNDVVLILSFSGETEEITRLLPFLAEVPIVAVTGKPDSSLAAAAEVTIDLGAIREACSLGLAPSTSTTAMLSVGDALALVMSRRRGFGPHDFVRFHPGGSLGLKLSKVDEVMRPLAECRVARQDQTLREVLVSVSRPGRRTGAVILVDDKGVLTGLFTDSDLARLLEANREAAISGPVLEVMTRDPKTVCTGTMMTEAIDLLATRRISELPVVDEEGRPAGLLDITDIVGLLPHDAQQHIADSEAESSAEPTTVRFPA